MGVTYSPELFADVGRGIRLCYQTIGDPADPPLLLINGLGGQLIGWPDGWCELLARRRFLVIRYDNRDAGLSTLGRQRVTNLDIVRAFVGGRVPAEYRMDDLGEDACGLLDALHIERAHVVGASMGGMIAQTLAVAHPDRVLSLVSVMSTTGDRRVGQPHPRLLSALLSRPPNDPDALADHVVRMSHLLASPGYPTPDAERRVHAAASLGRAHRPDGTSRQELAVLTQPDRTRALGGLQIPTAVVHGLSDPLVQPSGGRATAAAVPGAELILIPGMGHEIPSGVWPLVAGVVGRTASRAGGSRAAGIPGRDATG